MGLPINNLDPDNSDPPLRFGRVALIAKALFASLVLTLLSRGYFTFFDYGMPTHRQDSQPLKGAQLAQTYHAHSASPLPSPLQDNPEGERVWCFFDDSDTSTQSGDSYSHNFTMASSKLYFLNRSQAGGQLAFEAAASASGAKGEVRAHFSVASKKAGCSVNVCLVRNEGGQVGIAIYPHPDGKSARCSVDNYGEPAVDVQATVVFANPENASKPMNIDQVYTEMGLMSHHFKDLGSYAEVDAVSLQSERDIVVDALRTYELDLYAVNITVTVTVYWQANFLGLGGGRISANVTMVGTPAAPGDRYMRRLWVYNEYGQSDIDVSLVGTHPELHAVQYQTSVFSNYALARLHVLSMPPRANLGIVHQSWQGDSEIVLPPAFEGAFTFRSEDKMPSLVTKPNVPDPEGRGRNRTILVQRDEENYLMGGEVFWGDRPSDEEFQGYVLSKTFYAETALLL